MADRILVALPWRDNEELRVAINEYKGKEYFSVRIWWLADDSNGGEWAPGKQGMNIPIADAPKFVKAITDGLAAASKPAKQKKGGKR